MNQVCGYCEKCGFVGLLLRETAEFRCGWTGSEIVEKAGEHVAFDRAFREMLIVPKSSSLYLLPLPSIQERQQGSGDSDEIRKTEHALLDPPRHRAQLLQENAAREPAR